MLEEVVGYSIPKSHIQDDMIETYRKGMGAMEQRITELEGKIQDSAKICAHNSFILRVLSNVMWRCQINLNIRGKK